MIAVDTNVLVYAHRKDCGKHSLALSWLRALAEGEVPWGLPVFCLGEFVRVVTHRNIFQAPSSLDQALDAVQSLLESPSVRILFPGESYAHLFRSAVLEGGTTGNLVFDAQIAALCREYGIRRLLTEDRDFSRFPTLSIVGLDEDPATV